MGDAALPAKPKHGIQRMTKGNGMEMVLHATCNEGEGLPAWGDRPEGVESPLSASKRRTKRLQFTCNKCQQRTTRAVNPHALKSGTVFVQCSHCLVHHKIVDHLNLFEDAQVRASYIHPPVRPRMPPPRGAFGSSIAPVLHTLECIHDAPLAGEGEHDWVKSSAPAVGR